MKKTQTLIPKMIITTKDNTMTQACGTEFASRLIDADLIRWL